MDEFNLENLEEIELDLSEENICNIESVDNIISGSIQQNTVNNVIFTEKKNIKWQGSPFPTFNVNLQPIDEVQPEVVGFDIISSPITYFSKYFSEADFELMG